MTFALWRKRIHGVLEYKCELQVWFCFKERDFIPTKAKPVRCGTQDHHNEGSNMSQLIETKSRNTNDSRRVINLEDSARYQTYLYSIYKSTSLRSTSDGNSKTPLLSGVHVGYHFQNPLPTPSCMGYLSYPSSKSPSITLPLRVCRHTDRRFQVSREMPR